MKETKRTEFRLSLRKPLKPDSTPGDRMNLAFRSYHLWLVFDGIDAERTSEEG